MDQLKVFVDAVHRRAGGDEDSLRICDFVEMTPFLLLVRAHLEQKDSFSPPSEVSPPWNACWNGELVEGPCAFWQEKKF